MEQGNTTYQHRANRWSVGLFFFDLALVLLALSLAVYAQPSLDRGALTVEWGLYAMVGLFWGLALVRGDSCWIRSSTLFEELRALFKANFLALVLVASFLYFFPQVLPPQKFLLFGGLSFAFLLMTHSVHHALRARNTKPSSVLIVGATSLGLNIARQLSKNGKKVHVIGFVDDALAPSGSFEGFAVVGSTQDLTNLVSQGSVTEVIFALRRSAYNQLLALVQALEPFPVQISLVPDVLDLAWFTTRVEDLNGVPLLRLRHSPLDDSFNRALKRLMDLIIGSLTLVVTAPLMLLIGVLIRLDSPGPALIKQERIGEGGRPFGMYKFRTMYVDAPQRPPSGVPHKRRNDPRVTRLGRWLRRFSLDELPQLFNVLKGEMSLVGPRPELPWLVERYQPWQRRRFAVPPGMTGWWQINGRSERPMHEHVEDDLYYIRNYSLWLDIFILLRTIPAVIKGRGAF